MVPTRWRKSSHSGGSGGACVELAWRKSSYSGGNGGECVEVASATRMLVRDSKNPDGPALSFDHARFGRFLNALK
jgi:Domain of unknown function (DUF397)